MIIGNELRRMLKNDLIPLFTRENVIGYINKRIDRNFLIENIMDFGQHFYVCGTSDFVKSVSGYLIDLGVTSNSLLIEK